MKAVLFIQDKGKITNKGYQEINTVSKRTATSELTELVVKFKICEKSGNIGAGVSYKLIGQ